MIPVMEHDTQTDIYLPQPAVVRELTAMTNNEKLFRVQLESGAPLNYKPGQFWEISVPGYGEAPISVASSPTRTEPDEFEMVVRCVGSVTGALHRLDVGDRIGVRGPYGTTFPVDGAMLDRDVLFVLGGIGSCPVRAAIQYVLDRRADYRDVKILLGSRRPSERLFVDELAEWKRRDDITVLETVDAADESWTGHVGLITTLFPEIHVYPERTIAVVCGPPIMYKFVLLELNKLKIPPHHIFLSLERHMRCGVGKCGHCQIEDLYACQDGAVFNYADIASREEAI